MKVKTNTLTGAALDYAVAVAEGCNVAVTQPLEVGHTYRPAYPAIMLEGVGQHFRPRVPRYCTESAGDDIIDRERIGTEPLPHRNEPAWQAFIHSSSPYAYTVIGPTRRIAAMRCYVASRLGNEIDIPKDLL